MFSELKYPNLDLNCLVLGSDRPGNEAVLTASSEATITPSTIAPSHYCTCAQLVLVVNNVHALLL